MAKKIKADPKKAPAIQPAAEGKTADQKNITDLTRAELDQQIDEYPANKNVSAEVKKKRGDDLEILFEFFDKDQERVAESVINKMRLSLSRLKQSNKDEDPNVTAEIKRLSELIASLIEEVEETKRETARRVKEVERQLLESNEALEKSEKELARREKIGTFKKSALLSDQQLRYPGGNKSQLTIFDELLDITKNDILSSKTSWERVNNGIKLTPTETRMVTCLSKMLYHSSQNKDPKRNDYLIGNSPPAISEKTGYTAPGLTFTLYELAKEYNGGGSVSGKEIINIKAVLVSLSNKKFLIRYVREAKLKGGGRKVTTVESFENLVKIAHLSEEIYSNAEHQEGELPISNRKETVVFLNQIFRDQLDTKFLCYPNDIVNRTIKAFGSAQVSQATYTLIEYLNRETSSGRTRCEIGMEKLYYLLAPNSMKAGKKGRAKKDVEKALEAGKKIGIIQSFHEEKAKTSGTKMVFFMNEKWGEKTDSDYVPGGSDYVPGGSDYVPGGSDYVPGGSSTP